MSTVGIDNQIMQAKEMAGAGYSVSQICSAMCTTSIFVFNNASEELFSLPVNQERYPQHYQSFLEGKESSKELVTA